MVDIIAVAAGSRNRGWKSLADYAGQSCACALHTGAIRGIRVMIVVFVRFPSPNLYIYRWTLGRLVTACSVRVEDGAWDGAGVGCGQQAGAESTR